MRLSQFTNRVIEDAIKTANESYRDNDMLRCGSIAGLEACRGLEPEGLANLLIAANTAAVHSKRTRHPRTMEAIAFRTEIMWVCEVVSVVLDNQNLPKLVQPTPAAYMKAAEVIGSEQHLH
jgi:hypothetical protein